MRRSSAMRYVAQKPESRSPKASNSGVASSEVEIPMGILLELFSALLASGAAIPSALITIGQASSGGEGTELCVIGKSLQLGSTWNEAWREAPERYNTLERTLVHAWEFGAPVSQALRSARVAEEKEQESLALERAEKLGVQLALPLGLCFLPSFIVLAVVPIIAVMAESLF